MANMFTGMKKGIGEFFRPRNQLSRGARIGGAAIGSMFGRPDLGYKAGDMIADKWIDKDSAKEQGPIKGFIMRGEDPTGGMMTGGSPDMGKISNMFSSMSSKQSSPTVKTNRVNKDQTMAMLNMFANRGGGYGSGDVFTRGMYI